MSRDGRFSTNATFSKKLIRGYEILVFGKFCLRTKRMILCQNKEPLNILCAFLSKVERVLSMWSQSEWNKVDLIQDMQILSEVGFLFSIQFFHIYYLSNNSKLKKKMFWMDLTKGIPNKEDKAAGLKLR